MNRIKDEAILLWVCVLQGIFIFFCWKIESKKLKKKWMHSKELDCMFVTYLFNWLWKLYLTTNEGLRSTGSWCKFWIVEVESFGWQLVMKWRGDASQELSQLLWSPVDLIHKKFPHQEVIYWVMDPVADNDFHSSSMTGKTGAAGGSPAEQWPVAIHKRDHEKGTLVCWTNTVMTGNFFQVNLLFPEGGRLHAVHSVE